MGTDEASRRWRVGQLAAQTGLSVRTLHHYDDVGLLQPSERTAGGHRIYTGADVERLYAIVAMRRLNMSIADITAALRDEKWSLRTIMLRQRTSLAEEVAELTGLQRRLDDLTSRPGTIPSAEVIGAVERTRATPLHVRQALALLPYADVAGAQRWLVAAFRFEPGAITRDEAGNAIHAAVFAGSGYVHLHPPAAGLQPPGPGGTASAMVVVTVADADEHAEHAEAHGAVITRAPADMVYGVREYCAADPAGHQWTFHGPVTRE